MVVYAIHEFGLRHRQSRTPACVRIFFQQRHPRISFCCKAGRLFHRISSVVIPFFHLAYSLLHNVTYFILHIRGGDILREIL